MSDITFAILKVVVSVSVTLLTAFAIPYIKTLKANKRYQQMIDIVAVAVKAAEQQITESGQGAIKKERVMNFTREWLSSLGVDISNEQLSELIEAAVFGMKGGRL